MEEAEAVAPEAAVEQESPAARTFRVAEADELTPAAVTTAEEEAAAVMVAGIIPARGFHSVSDTTAGLGTMRPTGMDITLRRAIRPATMTLGADFITTPAATFTRIKGYPGTALDVMSGPF